MIKVRGIGVFARPVFEDPDRSAGQALEPAGDELTVPQIARKVGKRYATFPKALLRLMGKGSRMLFWFGESGYDAGIPALRALHPGLLSLDGWPAGGQRQDAR
ncbi:hypothetical protein ACIBQX_30205 [Nonomuraea sp. NPDC049714]|uniref:hypothetical protein n=1 Tax=Nonomuraea sp. NPDC049714 TaxID=3364357 RepID=UPI003793A9AE